MTYIETHHPTLQNDSIPVGIIAENQEIITENNSSSSKSDEISDEEQARLWVDKHLPELQSGQFYCWSKRTMDPERPDWAKKIYPFKNSFCKDKASLIDEVLRATDNPDFDVFVSPASFSRKKRKNDFVVNRRTIAFDFDVATPADEPKEATKKYPDLKTAAKAAIELGARLGVKMTFVKSGRGVHCYILLDADYAGAEVKVLADELKQWAITEGFNIDECVTGDIGRLMRMPGSVWRKNKTGLRVVLGPVGQPVSLQEARTLLRVASKDRSRVEDVEPLQTNKNQTQGAGADDMMARLQAHNQPVTIANNRNAIASVTDFLIANKAADRGYPVWWGMMKDYRGACDVDVCTDEDREFLKAQALRLSQESAYWRENPDEAEAEFEEKWSDTRIENGRIKNLFSFASNEAKWPEPWVNPGSDAVGVSLEEEEGKAGAISDKKPPTLSSVVWALSKTKATGVRIAYDNFTERDMIASADQDDWVTLTDAKVIELRMSLKRLFGFSTDISKEIMKDALAYVGHKNAIDTAQIWLGKLPAWDGVPRVDGFCENYLKTEAGDYAVSVGRYLFSALAGRVREPGVKADMALILSGRQGARKTTAVAALSPSDDFFGELDLKASDGDRKRAMRGKLVVELPELTGMRKTDDEHLKRVLSATFDSHTKKYDEYENRASRRCVFIGTTNRDDFLKDATGNRRYLPITVGDIDVEAIIRDRDQLWAEGVAIFKAEGIVWEQAEILAKDEHEVYREENAVVDMVAKTLEREFFDTNGKPVALKDKDHLRIADIIDLLEVRTADIKRTEHQIADALRRLGYEKGKRRVDGVSRPVWMKKAA